MEQYGTHSYGHQRSHPTYLPQTEFYGADGRRPYPFIGTVLMGALLNIAIFKLSPRTNAAHFVAIGVLGSLGVNSMHAILKLAGHTKSSSDFPMGHSDLMEHTEFVEEDYKHTPRNQSFQATRSPAPPQPRTFSQEPSLSPPPMMVPPPQSAEVYDSNLRIVHVLIVKPLSGLFELFIGPLTAIKGIREVASGVFHHIGPRYDYKDGRRDIQLLIAGIVTAIALKKIAPWVKPSLKADWQTVCTAVLIPTLWTKSTQLPLAKNGDPGKPWSWFQSIAESMSRKYHGAISQRGTHFGRKDQRY